MDQRGSAGPRRGADLLSQGVQLFLAGSAADDEIVGERRQAANVEKQDILAHLGDRCIHDCLT